jgi:branched-chain amino acid transport system ATP-binding protein
MLLEIEHLDAGYGDFQALFDVSLAIAAGEAVAVIGANGAGKSTLLMCIAGLVPVRRGEIRFDGDRIDGVPAHRRVARGISLVPEGRRIFPSLSVRENLRIGAYRRRAGPWTVDRVLAAFPLLARLVDRQASRLSGGEQQALAIARGLMGNPRLLLLDEVSLGLAPVVVRQLYAALPAIRESGTTLLLVEQDINQALAASDHVSCLLEGRVSLAGRPDDLDRDTITAAYFGMEASPSGGPGGAS